VGRDAQVEHLRQVLARASAGHGQVVALVGKPGVGKSRLTYEFTRSEQARDWLILQASSLSYGKTSGYLPIIDLLKGYFGIGDQDDHQEMHAKVQGRVTCLDPALEPLLSPLLALLDVPVGDSAWQSLDPPLRRQRTLEAVKHLLLRESQAKPVLVVFEDLHWVDNESQALLDSLVESLGSARLLLLVTYRPEYEHRWGSKTVYSQLRLDSLPPESAAELLVALLGPDPELAPLTQMLVRRGNPFFLEETVRTMAETGALTGERGRYRLTQPLQTLQVPATVQTILAARIDRLAPEDKRLLQCAAVVGKDVPFTLLVAIADESEELLKQSLARLKAAEFLYQTALFPDLEYTFTHALTHDVTYGMILGAQRRDLNLRLMQTIEARAAGRLDEYVDRLAHYALRAERWDKAVEFHRRAGLRAVLRSANRVAASHFQTALTCLARLPDTTERTAQAFDLHLDVHSAAIPLLDFEMADEHRQKAEDLAGSLGDPRRTGRVAASRAMASWLTGRVADAVAAAEEAIRIGSALSDTALLALGQDTLGRALYSQGHYQDAKAVLQRNIAMLAGDLARERFGQQGFTSVSSRHFLARCCVELGSFEEGRECAEQALAIAGDHPHSVLSASSAVAIVARDQGRFQIVVSTLERALALCESLDVKVWASVLASDLGYAYVLLRRLPEALPLLERAIDRGTDASRRLARLSVGYVNAGRLDDAVATAQRALAVGIDAGEPGSEAHALQVLGEVLSYGDRPDTASAAGHYQRALALAEPRGMRPLIAHCHLGLGKLYRQTGKRDLAQEHLNIAAPMYREMDMRFYLEQAEAELRGLA